MPHAAGENRNVFPFGMNHSFGPQGFLAVPSPAIYARPPSVTGIGPNGSAKTEWVAKPAYFSRSAHEHKPRRTRRSRSLGLGPKGRRFKSDRPD
jgi:hypothetical protein